MRRCTALRCASRTGPGPGVWRCTSPLPLLPRCFPATEEKVLPMFAVMKLSRIKGSHGGIRTVSIMPNALLAAPGLSQMCDNEVSTSSNHDP